MPQEINPQAKIFLEKLIEEKNFNNLSPELKETMIASLYPRLNSFIMQAVVKKLKNKDADELANLENDPNFSQELIIKELRTRMPELDEIIAKAMLEFKDIYLTA